MRPCQRRALDATVCSVYGARMRIAYLASAVTLPGSATRRADAFEHDQMMQSLQTQNRQMMDSLSPETGGGIQFEAIAWDDHAADWAAFDGVVIGTTWDYWDRVEAFLATLEQIEAATPLFNPSALVRWNCHKSYLRDLEARGARLIPTLWLEEASEAAVQAAFDQLGSDDLVFKRQVGAGADGQHRIRVGAPVPDMPRPMMAQPFQRAIQTEGEYSFVFVDGDLSHALVKRAKTGDYRIQSAYGGVETAIAPPKSDIAAATSILETLEARPLYARVDMVRGDDGALLLMELELIEPFLYPLQGPELGARMRTALNRRIG